MAAISIIPTATLFASITVAVSAIARSFKEAQYLLTPIYLASMVVIAVFQLLALDLTPWTALLPIGNVLLFIRSLIRGELHLLAWGIVLCSSAVYTGLALILAAKVFQSERILFSIEEETIPRHRRRQLMGWEAAALLLTVFALILFIGGPLQAKKLGVRLVGDGVGLDLHYRPSGGCFNDALTLPRRWPSDDRVTGPGWERPLQETRRGMSLALSYKACRIGFCRSQTSFKSTLASCLAAVAASCWISFCSLSLRRSVKSYFFVEHSFRRCASTCHRETSILLNGVLFGLFHLSPYRFFPTMLLGMLLSWIALRSRSLFPGMLFHFLNNACAVIVWANDLRRAR